MKDNIFSIEPLYSALLHRIKKQQQYMYLYGFYVGCFLLIAFVKRTLLPPALTSIYLLEHDGRAHCARAGSHTKLQPVALTIHKPVNRYCFHIHNITCYSWPTANGRQTTP